MKRLLTFFALIVFSAISGAAVVRVVQSELLPKERFDHAAFESWLATGNIEEADLGQVRRAARLLELDFQNDFDWRPTFESLSPTERKRFNANFGELAVRLFRQRAERYASLRRYHRERYLDAQLADFNHWYLLDDKGRKISGLELFRTEEFAKAAGIENPIMILFDGPGTGTETKPPDRPPATVEFVRDLRAHGMRKLRDRMTPGKPEPRRRED